MGRATTSARHDIHDIVAQCRRNNEAHGITGLLLCDGFQYLQAIEGEQQAVQGCRQLIFDDPRHTSFQIIRDTDILTRQCGIWSLNYHLQPSPAEVRAYVDKVMRDVADVTDSELQALFVGFARLAR